MTDLDEIRELILDQYEVNKQMHLNTQEALKAIMQFLEQTKEKPIPTIEQQLAAKGIIIEKRTRGEKESVVTAEISAKGSSIEKAIDDSKPVVKQEVVERINIDESPDLIAEIKYDTGKSFIIRNPDTNLVVPLAKSHILRQIDYDTETHFFIKPDRKWALKKLEWQEDKYK